MTNHPPSPMPFEDLERAYECLAEAIDRAGPHAEALFLTKLVLTLAHKLGDAAVFQASIDMALADLPASASMIAKCEPEADV